MSPMSRQDDISFATTLHIRDHCLCLHAQRAARTMARRFDEAFRRFDLTSGQFSLLVSLNRPKPARMSAVAELLGMDRTTLTAAIKPLRRRGLIRVGVDADDLRGRVLALTKAGRAVVSAAVPVWKRTHAEVERSFARSNPDLVRRDLLTLSA
jgi:DNA-binding MarR family transcriptional regulator